MTAFHRLSRGHAHSQKIKQSAGWARYCAERAGIPRTKWTRPEDHIAKQKARIAMREEKLRPQREALVAALRMDFDGGRAQISEAFQSGYIRALKDVKREREKHEAASYQAALGTISKQELTRISHAYDRDHR